MKERTFGARRIATAKSSQVQSARRLAYQLEQMRNNRMTLVFLSADLSTAGCPADQTTAAVSYVQALKDLKQSEQNVIAAVQDWQKKKEAVDSALLW